MRDLKRGATLHIHFTEVDPEEGTRTDLGEIVVEPNPEAAERFPGMYSSFLTSYLDNESEETFGAKVIGFQLARTFLDLAGEAMVSLGFLKH